MIYVRGDDNSSPPNTVVAHVEYSRTSFYGRDLSEMDHLLTPLNMINMVLNVASAYATAKQKQTPHQCAIGSEQHSFI